MGKAINGLEPLYARLVDWRIPRKWSYL